MYHFLFPLHSCNFTQHLYTLLDLDSTRKRLTALEALQALSTLLACARLLRIVRETTWRHGKNLLTGE